MRSTTPTHALPRRRADAHLEERGDDTVVVIDGSDEALLLNPTARALWELSDGATTPEEMAAAVVDLFDLPPTVARRDVDRGLAQLADAGLLVWIGIHT